MKTKRFQYEYRQNASKLHKAVGDCLRNSTIFSGYEIYQEYPVNKVNPTYHTSAHKFDWVIPKLKVIFEAHGIQHYECQTFGAPVEKALEAFEGIKERDQMKKQAAINAGYTYVEIPYHLDISEENLYRLYKENEITKVVFLDKEIPDSILSFKERQKQYRQRYLKSDEHKQYLEEARKKRKQRYQQTKERQNE